jgi:hypothetical protein
MTMSRAISLDTENRTAQTQCNLKVYPLLRNNVMNVRLQTQHVHINEISVVIVRQRHGFELDGKSHSQILIFSTFNFSSKSSHSTGGGETPRLLS